MIKRKIICTLLVLTVMIPCLFVAAFAFEATRQSTEISPYTTYTTCSCRKTSSSGITSHSGNYYDTCSNDLVIYGAYSCANTNYAKTSLTKCSYTGYKDTYVYECDSSGVTKTNYKYATGTDYPDTASVNPVNSYVPVCVRHEVSTPKTSGSSNVYLHIRNYE